jgi:hypothetical protein
MVRGKLGILAGLAVAGMLATSANAAVVSIVSDTSWHVVSGSPTVADPTLASPNAVLVNPINPGWTAQNDPTLAGANWISTKASNGNGTTDASPSEYTFLYDTNALTAFASWSVNFSMAADNFIKDVQISVNGGGFTTVFTGNSPDDPGAGDPTVPNSGFIWGFTLANVKSATGAASSGAGVSDFQILVHTFNYDTLNPPQGPGPEGFILKAVATSIGDPVVTPLPAAAWGGLSMIGGLGGLGILRRRRRVS